MRKFGRTKEQRDLAELLKATALLAPGGERAYLDVAGGANVLPVLPSILKLLALDGKSLIEVMGALPRETATTYARAPTLMREYVTALSLLASTLITASRRIDVALRTRADYAEIVAEAKAASALAKKGPA
jgi:hypothetical protein